jgi:hypothetical protein
MLAVHQPLKADSTRNAPLIPVGVDVGAGLTKMVIDSDTRQMRLRLPSQLIENKSELHDVLTFKDGGMWYYQSGDRSDLVGREFLIGTSAKAKDPKAHFKLSDNPCLQGRIQPAHDTWRRFLHFPIAQNGIFS